MRGLVRAGLSSARGHPVAGVCDPGKFQLSAGGTLGVRDGRDKGTYSRRRGSPFHFQRQRLQTAQGSLPDSTAICCDRPPAEFPMSAPVACRWRSALPAVPAALPSNSVAPNQMPGVCWDRGQCRIGPHFQSAPRPGWPTQSPPTPANRAEWSRPIS